MKAVIVLVLKGKGRNSSADTVTVRTFPNYDAANSFCEMTTDMESKYWTCAEIVEPGVAVDTQQE